jgi:hypothetical protein
VPALKSTCYYTEERRGFTAKIDKVAAFDLQNPI